MRSRYVHATRRGGPGVLAVREREMAVLPAPGEALVRVAAAGVSYGDILLRVGVNPGGPKPPFTPGFEIAGVVEATGEGVTGLAKWQVVAGLVRNGGYIDLLAVPAARLARLGGIQVHATASAAKHDLIREPGGHPIDYRGADFVAVTREQTGGTGVAAAFDPIGGGHFRASCRVLRRGGTLVGFGQSAAFANGKARMRTGAWGMIGGIAIPKLIPGGKKTVAGSGAEAARSRQETR